ncbi:MAG: hypothetical protein N2234_02250 [Planctomycetota bacterium]|nr:hypothetical protein [Planctomycetota bacterium]
MAFVHGGEVTVKGVEEACRKGALTKLYCCDVQVHKLDNGFCGRGRRGDI